MNNASVLLVNSCRRTRPVARALGLKLKEQRRGTQYYRAHRSSPAALSGSEEATEIHMVNAHGDALDVCIRTAEFFGRNGTTSAGEMPHARKERIAVFFGEDTAATRPSLAVAVEGPLLEHPYYPDMLATSGFDEIRSTGTQAAGFAAAISRLCGPHQVLIVLMHPDSDRETLGEAAEATLGLAHTLIGVRPTTVALSDEDYRKIAACARSRGASTAEASRLVHAAHAAHVRGGDAAVILEAADKDQNARELLEFYERLHTGDT